MRTRRSARSRSASSGSAATTSAAGSTRPRTRAVIDAALDAGVTFFDTADIYGDGRQRDAARQARCRAGATGSCWRRSSGSRWATAPSGAAARRTSARRSTRRCAPADRAGRPVPAPRRGSRDAARGDRRRARGARRRGQDPRVRHLELRARRRSARTAALARRRRTSPEQSEYSWLERGAEAELLPTCERLGLGFIPYFPLAQRPAHRQGDARRSRRRRARGSTAARSTGASSTRVEASAPLGRGARRLAPRRGGRRTGRPSARRSRSVIAGRDRSPSRCARTRRRASGSRLARRARGARSR